MKNAVLIDISFSTETIKYIPELFCDKNGKRVFVVAFITNHKIIIRKTLNKNIVAPCCRANLASTGYTQQYKQQLCMISSRRSRKIIIIQ